MQILMALDELLAILAVNVSDWTRQSDPTHKHSVPRPLFQEKGGKFYAIEWDQNLQEPVEYHSFRGNGGDRRHAW